MAVVSFEARIRYATQIIALALSQFIGAAWYLSAAPVTWDGGGDPNFSWMNGANWLGDVAPMPGIDDLHFAANMGPNNTNDFAAGSQFNGLTFDTGATAFTLGGNQMKLAGDLINKSANQQSVILPLVIIGNRTVDAGNSGLNLANVTGGTASQTLTLQGTGGVLSGTIAGTSLRLQQNTATSGSDTDTWSILGNSTSNFSGSFALTRGIMNFGSASDAPKVNITLPTAFTTDFFALGGSTVFGATSTFNMKSGTLTLNAAGNFVNPGRLVFGNAADVNSHGVWNQTGGTVVLQGFSGGTSSCGVFIANQTASVAQFNISGGTFDAGSAPFTAAVRGNGQLNVSGTGLLKTTALLTLNGGADPSAASVVNLDGGTLQVGGVTAALNSSAVFNFNGGVLKAAGNTFGSFWRSAGSNSNAFVKAGGAIIDTAGFDMQIQVPLVHDPALGTTLDGGLTKNGAGKLTLSASAHSPPTYSGPTTINAGTLELAGTAAISAAPITDNGTLRLSNTFNIDTGVFGLVLANNISGTGGVTVYGTSAVTLSGTNTYTGITQISFNALVVNGSLASTGTVNVDPSGTLAGTGDGVTTGVVGNVVMSANASIRPGAIYYSGVIGTLTMSSLTATSANLQFDLSTPANSDKITVKGAASFSGSSTVAISSIPAAGTYVLLTAGSLSGAAPVLQAPPVGSTRANSTLQFDTTAAQLRLQVAADPKTLTWTGTNGSTWDLHTTQNWSDNGGPISNETYFDFDTVVFEDTAVNRNVVLTSKLFPTTVIFNNSMGIDYTISGPGAIGDESEVAFPGVNTQLTKTGGGKLTLLTANSYRGNTKIQNGTLVIGVANAIGNSNVVLGTSTTTGILDLNGLSPTLFAVSTTFGNSTGIIGNSSTSTKSTLTISQGSTFAGVIQDSIAGGTQTIALEVAKYAFLDLSGDNTFSGGTVIDSSGELQLGNGGTTGSVDLAGVVNQGTLAFDRSDPITLTAPVTGGGGIEQRGSGVLSILFDSTFNSHHIYDRSTLHVGNGGTVGSLGKGSVQIEGLLILDRSDGSSANPLIIANDISGIGVAQKSGAGTMRLTGNNTYLTGQLIVSQGTIQLGSANALGSTAAVTAAGGTLDLRGQNLGALNALNLVGSGDGGQGALINTGAAATVQNIVLTGDATIGGPGQIDLSKSSSTFQTAGNQPHSLTKIGAGRLGIFSSRVSSNLTDIKLDEGTLSISLPPTAQGLGDPAKTLSIESPAILNMSNSAAALNKRIVSDGGLIWASAGTGTSNTIVGQQITLNATTTFQTSADATANVVLTVNSPIDGPGGLTKSAVGSGAFAGTLFLGGANTYTGPTKISGGTLQLTAADRISDTSNLILAGGTFTTGGFHETLGQLALMGNSTTDLGVGSSVLHFANSSLQAWTGTLTISNWDGQLTGGGVDAVFFGSNGYSGLTHAQLNSIKFNSMPTGAKLLATGELVPNSGPLLPLPVLADFDGNGSLSSGDISAMLLALADLPTYQATHLISDGDLLAIGDFDHSGVIDNRDIQPMVDYIIASVPEPAGWLLFILFAFAVLSKRHFLASHRLCRGSR